MVRDIANLTFSFQRIGGRFRFRNVDDSVDVERDLFAIRRPGLVAEAVDVFAVKGCCEGVFVRGGVFGILPVTRGVLDLLLLCS